MEAEHQRIDGITEMRYGALVEEGGVYWFDWDGALYASPPDGSAPPRLLRPAPAEPIVVLGVVADETNLYWGEARGPDPGGPPEPGPPPPPGRLYSIPKAGGEATLLLEDPSVVLRPLAAPEEGLLASPFHGEGLLSVAKDGSASHGVAPDVPAEEVRVIEGKLYWAVPVSSSEADGDRYDLWRADLDGSNAERVARIESPVFLAGNDRILWHRERTHTDPLVLEQTFILLDESTGCTQPLPGLGESISHASVMDARHVYWYGYNALEGVTGGTGPDGNPSALPVKPLVRVDLRTGAFEHIITPGFEAVVGDNLVGQTEGRLYVSVSGELVAIRKP